MHARGHGRSWTLAVGLLMPSLAGPLPAKCTGQRSSPGAPSAPRPSEAGLGPAAPTFPNLSVHQLPSGQTGRVTPEGQAAVWAARPHRPGGWAAAAPRSALPCGVAPAMPLLAHNHLSAQHPISQVLSTGPSSATDEHAQASFALKNKTLSDSTCPLVATPAPCHSQ